MTADHLTVEDVRRIQRSPLPVRILAAHLNVPEHVVRGIRCPHTN